MDHDVAIPAFSPRLFLRFGGLVLPGENLPAGPGPRQDDGGQCAPCPGADVSASAPSGVPSGSGGREAALALLVLRMMDSARRHARNAGKYLARAEDQQRKGLREASVFSSAYVQYHHGAAVMASADAAELARVLR